MAALREKVCGGAGYPGYAKMIMDNGSEFSKPEKKGPAYY